MIGNFFKNLDIFGTSFNFHATNTTPVFKTKCGAILSVTCIILVSSAVYIFTEDYKDTENPRVTISSERGNEWPELNIQDEGLFGVFFFSTPFGPIPVKDIPKYLTIRMTKQTYSINPKNPNETIWTSEGPLKYVDCRKTKVREDIMNDHLNSSGAAYFYNHGFLLCPENTENWDIWKISGSPNTLPWTFIKVDFLPCSLPNEADCVPKDAFSYIRGRFSAISKNYKLSDKENPIQSLYQSDMILYGINPYTVETHIKKIKETFVYNEDKDFVGSKLKAKFFAFSDKTVYTSYRSGSSYCPPEKVNSPYCVPYTSTFFTSGSEKEKVLRLYPKLFSTVSELGGFGDLIFILVGLIYSFYISYHYKKFVKKNILDENFEGKYREMIKSLNGSLNEKVVDIELNQFYKERLSGIETAKNSGAVKGMIDLMMGPQYSKILPVLSLMKKKYNNEVREENCSGDPFEFILNDKPKRPIEVTIQRELKEVFSMRRIEEEIILNNLQDDECPRTRKSMKELKRSLWKKKKIATVQQNPFSRMSLDKKKILRKYRSRRSRMDRRKQKGI